MPDRAKLFRSGGSQAVRLPKAFRFEGREVLIYRRGKRVVLEAEPKSWSEAFRRLAGSAPDFPYPGELPRGGAGPDLS